MVEPGSHEAGEGARMEKKIQREAERCGMERAGVACSEFGCPPAL